MNIKKLTEAHLNETNNTAFEGFWIVSFQKDVIELLVDTTF